MQIALETNHIDDLLRCWQPEKMAESFQYFLQGLGLGAYQ